MAGGGGAAVRDDHEPAFGDAVQARPGDGQGHPGSRADAAGWRGNRAGGTAAGVRERGPCGRAGVYAAVLRLGAAAWVEALFLRRGAGRAGETDCAAFGRVSGHDRGGLPFSAIQGAVGRGRCGDGAADQCHQARHGVDRSGRAEAGEMDGRARGPYRCPGDGGGGSGIRFSRGHGEVGAGMDAPGGPRVAVPVHQRAGAHVAEKRRQPGISCRGGVAANCENVQASGGARARSPGAEAKRGGWQ